MQTFDHAKLQLLESFCTVNPKHPLYVKPFICGGYVVATNVSVLVAFELSSFKELPKDLKRTKKNLDLYLLKKFNISVKIDVKELMFFLNLPNLNPYIVKMGSCLVPAYRLNCVLDVAMALNEKEITWIYTKRNYYPNVFKVGEAFVLVRSIQERQMYKYKRKNVLTFKQ